MRSLPPQLMGPKTPLSCGVCFLSIILILTTFCGSAWTQQHAAFLSDVAEQLARHFPKVTGEVVKVEGDRIYLSLGARDHILPKLQLTLSRPRQLTAGSDGEEAVNRTEEAIGYVIVEEVFERYAVARLLEMPGTTAQRGDKVRITSGPVILGLLPVAGKTARASGHGNLTTALQSALQANARFDVVSANRVLLWSLEQGAPLEDGLTPEVILRMAEALRFNYVVIGTVKEVDGKAVLDVALLSPRLQRLVASSSTFLPSP